MTITKDNILKLAASPITRTKLLEELKIPDPSPRHLSRLESLISKLRKENKLIYFAINDEVYYETNSLSDSNDTN